MKHTSTKIAAAIGAGLIACGSAAYATTASEDMNSGSPVAQENSSFVGKVEHGTSRVAHSTVRGSKRLAHATVRDSREVAHATVRDSRSFAGGAWDESKRIARTVVYSPVIAYHVVRGDRPLFTRENASDNHGQIALSGHRPSMESRSGVNARTRQSQPSRDSY